jgi:AhpD family alkylhydroperoxidase
VQLIGYADATAEVRAVYDDIRATRQTDDINNFWQALANDPPTLRRTWNTVEEVTSGPGNLDSQTRELIYIAVNVTNNCDYCIASHTASARAKGMTDGVLSEVLAIAATANATNRLTIGYRIPIDSRFASDCDATRGTAP